MTSNKLLNLVLLGIMLLVFAAFFFWGDPVNHIIEFLVLVGLSTLMASATWISRARVHTVDAERGSGGV